MTGQAPAAEGESTTRPQRSLKLLQARPWCERLCNSWFELRGRDALKLDSRGWILRGAKIGYFALRRISLVEFIKRGYGDPEAGTGPPASFLDCYVTLVFLFWLALVSFFRFGIEGVRWDSLFPLYVALQLLQTSTWHTFFRHKLYPANHVMRKAHDAFRNLIYALLNFCFLNVLFAAAYSWSSEHICQEFSWPNSIYFAFVTGTTLGYGDVTPMAGDWWIKSIVIAHVVASLVLLAVVLASTVSALPSTDEEL